MDQDPNQNPNGNNWHDRWNGQPNPYLEDPNKAHINDFLRGLRDNPDMDPQVFARRYSREMGLGDYDNMPHLPGFPPPPRIPDEEYVRASQYSDHDHSEDIPVVQVIREIQDISHQFEERREELGVEEETIWSMATDGETRVNVTDMIKDMKRMGQEAFERFGPGRYSSESSSSDDELEDYGGGDPLGEMQNVLRSLGLDVSQQGQNANQGAGAEVNQHGGQAEGAMGGFGFLNLMKMSGQGAQGHQGGIGSFRMPEIRLEGQGAQPGGCVGLPFPGHIGAQGAQTPGGIGGLRFPGFMERGDHSLSVPSGEGAMGLPRIMKMDGKGVHAPGGTGEVGATGLQELLKIGEQASQKDCGENWTARAEGGEGAAGAEGETYSQGERSAKSSSNPQNILDGNGSRASQNEAKERTKRKKKKRKHKRKDDAFFRALLGRDLPRKRKERNGQDNEPGEDSEGSVDDDKLADLLVQKLTGNLDAENSDLTEEPKQGENSGRKQKETEEIRTCLGYKDGLGGGAQGRNNAQDIYNGNKPARSFEKNLNEILKAEMKPGGAEEQGAAGGEGAAGGKKKKKKEVVEEVLNPGGIETARREEKIDPLAHLRQKMGLSNKPKATNAHTSNAATYKKKRNVRRTPISTTGDSGSDSATLSQSATIPPARDPASLPTGNSATVPRLPEEAASPPTNTNMPSLPHPHLDHTKGARPKKIKRRPKSAREETQSFEELLQHEKEKAHNSRDPIEDALCTIIVLDASASMTGPALKKAKKAVRDIITSLDQLPELHENMALLVLGQRLQVVRHLTCDRSIIERSLENIEAGGATPLAMALALSVTALDRVRTPDIRGHIISPRMIIISDFVPTDDPVRDKPPKNQDDREAAANQIVEVAERLKEEYHVTINCIPVGNNQDLPGAIAAIADGVVVQPGDAQHLCKEYLRSYILGYVLGRGQGRTSINAALITRIARELRLMQYIEDEDVAVILGNAIRIAPTRIREAKLEDDVEALEKPPPPPPPKKKKKRWGKEVVIIEKKKDPIKLIDKDDDECTPAELEVKTRLVKRERRRQRRLARLMAPGRPPVIVKKKEKRKRDRKDDPFYWSSTDEDIPSDETPEQWVERIMRPRRKMTKQEAQQRVDRLMERHAPPPKLDNLPYMLEVNTRVKVGPDWMWNLNKVPRDCIGTVRGYHEKDEGWITVKWDNGVQNEYRYGVDYEFDIVPEDGGEDAIEFPEGKCRIIIENPYSLSDGSTTSTDEDPDVILERAERIGKAKEEAKQKAVEDTEQGLKEFFEEHGAVTEEEKLTALYGRHPDEPPKPMIDTYHPKSPGRRRRVLAMARFPPHGQGAGAGAGAAEPEKPKKGTLTAEEERRRMEEFLNAPDNEPALKDPILPFVGNAMNDLLSKAQGAEGQDDPGEDSDVSMRTVSTESSNFSDDETVVNQRTPSSLSSHGYRVPPPGMPKLASMKPGIGEGATPKVSKPGQPKYVEVSTSESDSDLDGRQFIWQWKDPKGRWCNYTEDISRKIETTFRKKQTRTCVIEHQGYSERVVFKTMKQQNNQLKIDRDVQRVEIDPALASEIKRKTQ